MYTIKACVYVGDITIAQTMVLPLGHSIGVKGLVRGADSFQPQEQPSRLTTSNWVNLIGCYTELSFFFFSIHKQMPHGKKTPGQKNLGIKLEMKVQKRPEISVCVISTKCCVQVYSAQPRPIYPLAQICELKGVS